MRVRCLYRSPKRGGPITTLPERLPREYLGVFQDADIDTLVLGCTHYPLLKGVIGEVMGKGVTLVDSAIETALEVVRVLDENGTRATSGGDFSVILSDTSPTFDDVASRFLGRAIPEIELVSI